MHQPPDDRNCCLHDRPCSNLHVDHNGAHPHHRCSESPCSTAIDHRHLHYLCHNNHGDDEHSLLCGHTTVRNAPEALSTTNTSIITTPTSSDVDSVSTCSHCDHTSISHVGLVGHLRIYHTVTGEPVSGASTCTRHIRLHCPHTFTHFMSLLGHIRIRVSGILRSIGIPSIPRTPTTTTTTTISAAAATTNTKFDSFASDLFYPNCPRNSPHTSAGSVTHESIAQRLTKLVVCEMLVCAFEKPDRAFSMRRRASN
ncbi:hypothetical protein SprV_0200833400 [Sparganum proliferum]